jgi:ribosome biogenesis GTPase
MKRARVIEEHKTSYLISDEGQEFTASVRGSFHTSKKFPKVGDIVGYTNREGGTAVIEKIFPRTTSIIRKSVKTGTPQVIVANVDVMFIVMGLDNDFNLSRLERYLLLAKQSEVQPVIVLTKSDIVEDIDTYIEQVKTVSEETPVHAVSALHNVHMDTLLTYLKPDTTAVLLGSSGTGKSTIINWLLNDTIQQVKAVREDDSHGRHTTTSRQLFVLPTGACVIDTPGMRELSVLDSTPEDESEVFSKIDELSTQCTYRKCDHEKSDGCAVKKALENGEISERELQNYHKLQRERLFEESKKDEELSWEYKQSQRKLHKGYNKIMERKRFEEKNF